MGYSAFLRLSQQLQSLNESQVFRQGGAQWASKNNNHVKLFHHHKIEIQNLLISIEKQFYDLLRRPPLMNMPSWIQAQNANTCSKQLDLNLPFYATLADMIELEKSNWLSPQHPINRELSWRQKQQEELDNLINQMSKRNRSFNIAEIRNQRMDEHFRTIMVKIFQQQEDTLLILPQVVSYLKDLDNLMLQFFQLLNSCERNFESARLLAFSACTHLLRKSSYSTFVVEALGCEVAAHGVKIDFRLHQRSLWVEQGAFQKAVIGGSALTIFTTVITYAYFCHRLYKRITKKQPTAPVIRAVKYKPSSRKKEPKGTTDSLITLEPEAPPPYPSNRKSRRV